MLLASSEIEELVGLCDRILVVRRGEIVARFARPGLPRPRERPPVSTARRSSARRWARAPRGGAPVTRVLRYPALLMLVLVGGAFSLLSPRFLDPANLVNIVVQSASVGIVATGMAFVLLTAGIDLSVGAVMFVSAAVAGKMAVAGAPVPAVFGAILAIGALCGAVNAFFVTRAGVKAFVATLATLYVGRGLGLWITETRALNLPEAILRVGAPASSARPSPRSPSVSSWSPLTSCSPGPPSDGTSTRWATTRTRRAGPACPRAGSSSRCT